MSAAPHRSKNNIPVMIGTVVAIAAFCVTTFVVIDQAGGTKLSPDYSNTPNAVVSGAPEFK